MRYFAYALSFFGLIGAVAYLGIRAPEFHGNYIVNKVGAKSVRLVSPTNHNHGGTGFSVTAPSGNQYTLTNGHVCGVAVNGLMDAGVPGTDRYYSLRVLEVSEFTDLCLLENMPGYSGVELADSVRLGEEIAVVGHPLLMPITLSIGRMTAYQTIEILISVNEPQEACTGPTYNWIDLRQDPASAFGVYSVCLRRVSAVYTTVRIYPGNSGSPAVNFFGNLVGVAFAGENTTNFGYMIPLHDIKKFLEIY